MTTKNVVHTRCFTWAPRLRFSDRARAAVVFLVRQLHRFASLVREQVHRPEVAATILMILLGMVLFYLLLMTPFSPYGL